MRVDGTGSHDLTIAKHQRRAIESGAVPQRRLGTGFDEASVAYSKGGPLIGPDHRREKMAPKLLGKEDDMTKKTIISKKTRGGKNIKAHRRKHRIGPGKSAQIHQNIYAEGS